MTDKNKALKIIGEIGKISLQPGDVLVITCQHAVSAAEFERIGKTVRALFSGHKFVVLDRGTKIEVAREQADG